MGEDCPHGHVPHTCTPCGRARLVDGLRNELEGMRAERDMLREEIRRLACCDLFVTEDGRTVSCGLADGHGGPCEQRCCSEYYDG